MTEYNGVERTKTELAEVERLRAMLDERGIEYDAVDQNGDQETWWNLNGVRYRYSYHVGCKFGSLSISCANFLTPEQAIAATVGEEHEMHICKRCGVAYELNIIDKGFGKPRFCPNCGYKELYQ